MQEKAPIRNHRFRRTAAALSGSVALAIPAAAQAAPVHNERSKGSRAKAACDAVPKHQSPSALADERALAKAFVSHRAESFKPGSYIWSRPGSGFTFQCETISPLIRSGHLYGAEQTGLTDKTVKYFRLPAERTEADNLFTVLPNSNPQLLNYVNYGRITTRHAVLRLDQENQPSAKVNILNNETDTSIQRHVPIALNRVLNTNVLVAFSH